MATLAKPKHGDLSSWRSRNARWRLEKRIDPVEAKHYSRKDRNYCKPNPDHEHVFAEWLLNWRHDRQDGTVFMVFVLSCVYCKQQSRERGSHKYVTKDVKGNQAVKWGWWE